MKKTLAIVLMLVLTVALACPVFASAEPAPAAAAAAPAAEAQTDTVVIKEPTCTTAGYAAVYNVETNEILSTVLLPATGEHNYVAEVQEATCTEDGVTTYTCTMCGDTYTEVTAPASGHNYTYQYDATRNADGSFATFGTWKCENCGDVVEATEGNAVYYYGLQEEAAAPAPAASGEPSAAPSGEASAASGETAPAEEPAPEVSNPNYDPAAHNWASIEIVMTIVIVVVGAVLMLSFGKKKNV